MHLDGNCVRAFSSESKPPCLQHATSSSLPDTVRDDNLQMKHVCNHIRSVKSHLTERQDDSSYHLKSNVDKNDHDTAFSDCGHAMTKSSAHASSSPFQCMHRIPRSVHYPPEWGSYFPTTSRSSANAALHTALIEIDNITALMGVSPTRLGMNTAYHRDLSSRARGIRRSADPIDYRGSDREEGLATSTQESIYYSQSIVPPPQMASVGGGVLHSSGSVVVGPHTVDLPRNIRFKHLSPQTGECCSAEYTRVDRDETDERLGTTTNSVQLSPVLGNASTGSVGNHGVDRREQLEGVSSAVSILEPWYRDVLENHLRALRISLEVVVGQCGGYDAAPQMGTVHDDKPCRHHTSERHPQHCQASTVPLSENSDPDLGRGMTGAPGNVVIATPVDPASPSAEQMQQSQEVGATIEPTAPQLTEAAVNVSEGLMGMVDQRIQNKSDDALSSVFASLFTGDHAHRENNVVSYAGEGKPDAAMSFNNTSCGSTGYYTDQSIVIETVAAGILNADTRAGDAPAAPANLSLPASVACWRQPTALSVFPLCDSSTSSGSRSPTTASISVKVDGVDDTPSSCAVTSLPFQQQSYERQLDGKSMNEKTVPTKGFSPPSHGSVKGIFSLTALSASTSTSEDAGRTPFRSSGHIHNFLPAASLRSVFPSSQDTPPPSTLMVAAAPLPSSNSHCLLEAEKTGQTAFLIGQCQPNPVEEERAEHVTSGDHRALPSLLPSFPSPEEPSSHKGPLNAKIEEQGSSCSSSSSSSCVLAIPLERDCSSQCLQSHAEEAPASCPTALWGASTEAVAAVVEERTERLSKPNAFVSSSAALPPPRNAADSPQKPLRREMSPKTDQSEWASEAGVALMPRSTVDKQCQGGVVVAQPSEDAAAASESVQMSCQTAVLKNEGQSLCTLPRPFLICEAFHHEGNASTNCASIPNRAGDDAEEENREEDSVARAGSPTQVMETSYTAPMSVSFPEALEGSSTRDSPFPLSSPLSPYSDLPFDVEHPANRYGNLKTGELCTGEWMWPGAHSADSVLPGGGGNENPARDFAGECAYKEPDNLILVSEQPPQHLQQMQEPNSSEQDSASPATSQTTFLSYHEELQVSEAMRAFPQSVDLLSSSLPISSRGSIAGLTVVSATVGASPLPEPMVSSGEGANSICPIIIPSTTVSIDDYNIRVGGGLRGMENVSHAPNSGESEREFRGDDPHALLIPSFEYYSILRAHRHFTTTGRRLRGISSSYFGAS